MKISKKATAKRLRAMYCTIHHIQTQEYDRMCERGEICLDDLFCCFEVCMLDAKYQFGGLNLWIFSEHFEHQEKVNEMKGVLLDKINAMMDRREDPMKIETVKEELRKLCNNGW